MMERETAVEVVVSAAGVLVFLAAAAAAVMTSGGDLAGQGGLALVGAVLLFVLFMGAIGYYLAGREH